ncbi:bifunctional epoxide hydrolase 2-like [Glandiceps talaboti]
MSRHNRLTRLLLENAWIYPSKGARRIRTLKIPPVAALVCRRYLYSSGTLHCNALTGQKGTDMKKAVIFDIGGVIITPPQSGIKSYGESLGLPGNFLELVMIKGRPNNAFCKMERGELTVREFLEEYKEEVKTTAKEANINLPAEFDPKKMFDAMTECKVVMGMLQALLALRNNGFKTCILTNNFINDVYNKELDSQFILVLRHYADHIVESCRVGIRKPSPDIFKIACDKMGVDPSETVFLDDIGSNLKPARQMGIHTIKVEDPDVALKQLQEATNVNVFEEQPPPAAKPDMVPHSYITTKDGYRIHYVDVGQGPAVVCCHGFPESWYSWRYQIPALALAGYRVIVPDMRGYGDSSSPPEIEEYSQVKLCGDLVALLDTLAIPHATFVGHDWGGSVVWNMGLFYPDRTRAVAGINTPLFPVNTKKNPLKSMQENPGRFDYQLYFQTPGVAEAEFEKNIDRSIKCFMSVSTDLKAMISSGKISKGTGSTATVTKRGGMLVGFPDKPPVPSTMKQEDIDYYVQQFKKTGFRGPLNWYRNIETNWKEGCKIPHRKVRVPSLMVTASYDYVLTPESSRFMEPWVPDLTRANLECGHWTQVEKPRELNEILVSWLDKVHKKSVDRLMAKL